MLSLLALACLDTAGSRATDDAQEGRQDNDVVGPDSQPSNLIVIGIDTLRADRIGGLGGLGDIMPNLDAVLGETLLLTDHRSCSNWTFGALTCLWTGAYGEDVGFVPEGSYSTPEPAPDDLGTIPRWLSEKKGFTSVLVGTSPWFGNTWKLTNGFDIEAISSTASGAEIGEWVESMVPSLGEDGQPWMLQVHLLDPHMPFTAPPDYREGIDVDLANAFDLSTVAGINKAIEAYEGMGTVGQEQMRVYFNAVYDAEVREADDYFGRIWQTLESNGLLDDAVVVLFSDHGEQFAEHDLWAHGQSLHDEETRAVGALWAPGLAAQTWTEPTSVIDLLPTALSWMGFDPPGYVGGVRIGDADPDRPRYLVQGAAENTVQGVDMGSLRLIYDWSEGMSLYDLSSDPDELDDLWVGSSEETAELESLLREQEAKLDPLIDR